MPNARHNNKIPSSEITDERIYRQRRLILQAGLGLGLGNSIGVARAKTDSRDSDGMASQTLPRPRFFTDEEQTTFKSATTYNNFLELGTRKGDPARNARQLKTSPWNVVVEGQCGKPGSYTLEDILKPHTIEERVMRHRCVEAWSMVIPWNGFSLPDLLKRFEPGSNAKYVLFQTLHDPKRLLEQRSRILDWPYVEALRIDEAMHPLATVATGMYGKTMPNQNGAPIRLVIPWKYGFKSIKSIVRIRFTESRPDTTWNIVSPREYGFYANVNPDVSHPRWSQARERRLSGETGGLAALFSPRIETRFLNGYADEVGSLYSGMDLKRHY